MDVQEEFGVLQVGFAQVAQDVADSGEVSLGLGLLALESKDLFLQALGYALSG